MRLGGDHITLTLEEGQAVGVFLPSGECVHIAAQVECEGDSNRVATVDVSQGIMGGDIEHDRQVTIAPKEGDIRLQLSSRIRPGRPV